MPHRFLDSALFGSLLYSALITTNVETTSLSLWLWVLFYTFSSIIFMSWSSCYSYRRAIPRSVKLTRLRFLFLSFLFPLRPFLFPLRTACFISSLIFFGFMAPGEMYRHDYMTGWLGAYELQDVRFVSGSFPLRCLLFLFPFRFPFARRLEGIWRDAMEGSFFFFLDRKN